MLEVGYSCSRKKGYLLEVCQLKHAQKQMFEISRHMSRANWAMCLPPGMVWQTPRHAPKSVHPGLPFITQVWPTFSQVQATYIVMGRVMACHISSFLERALRVPKNISSLLPPSLGSRHAKSTYGSAQTTADLPIFFRQGRFCRHSPHRSLHVVFNRILYDFLSLFTNLFALMIVSLI